jgi:hypothetical protein
VTGNEANAFISTKKFDEKTWPYFLQHLPVLDSPIVDYKGRLVANQDKHVGILDYDVGKTDLQQCADALMRLRAEYLFDNYRYDEIGFHFTGGQYYTWNDYCKGIRVVPYGNDIKFIHTSDCNRTHETLRKYLDIVYTYASTISLAKELKNGGGFEIGTVIIYPGSPGHCFIIVDEAKNNSGERVYKLVEGYTPAQSIYVLRNPGGEGNSPWYKLDKGIIKTASYTFTEYQLKKFE